MRTAIGIIVVLLTAVTASFAQGVEAQSASPLGNADGGRVETAIGDLAADSIRELLNANIAFVAASELKPKDPPFPAGKINSNDIAALVSYPNDSLAVLQLTGRQVKEALEKSVSIHPQRNLGFLQVSGLKFTFDPGKPSGARVTSVTIGNAQVSDNANYTVGVTSSMANGALGYWKVWTKGNITRRVPDATIVKGVENYFRSHPRINYGNLDRIKATP